MKHLLLFATIALIPKLAAADKPFNTAPNKHAFDLRVFNGIYRLVSETGEPPCPGTGGSQITIRFASHKPNSPVGSQRFNDHIGFFNDAGGMSESIDFIDQGKEILAYVNGPSTLLASLGCKILYRAPEAQQNCHKGNENNDAYYAEKGIQADGTKVETESFSAAGMIIRDQVESRHTQFTKNTDYSEEVRRIVLARNGSAVTLTSFVNGEPVRECSYKKVE